MAEVIVDRGIDNRIDEIYGTEATMYYPGLYAGSVDLVARLDGEIAIIDFKQTNKPKQREWIGDYFLQMAAYGMAHDYVYGTEINKGVIMMCSKDNYYQVQMHRCAARCCFLCYSLSLFMAYLVAPAL